MCGFAGFLSSQSLSSDERGCAVLKRMTDAIAYRGPDDAGSWCDLAAGIGLGHRRLSIVDLSPAGHQPMRSGAGRYVIAFNGEIYNHADLRGQLQNAGFTGQWRGHSDTETLLAGFDAWGIQATVERTIGMFAFAVWDRQTQTLTLGRDRIGEKPLYYGWQGEGQDAVFLFGSELKALRAHAAFNAEISRTSLVAYLRCGYVPAPHSIYGGIAKLPPGNLLSVSLRQRKPALTVYWSGRQVIESGLAHPFPGSPDQAVSELDGLLRDAVRHQMTADVPLGAFLSGGVDSSTVVALMQAQSVRPVRTFSIGFHEKAYNEADHAKAVAGHLRTEHTEMYVSAREAMDVIPRLPAIYDEPFADSSQIPTFLVSQIARQHVTVSLSGDAGDELFCGYDRYRLTSTLWKRLALLPLPLRRLAKTALTGVSVSSWNRLGRALSSVFSHPPATYNLGDKLHKGAGIVDAQSFQALYLELMSHWHNPTAVVIGSHEPYTFLNDEAANLANHNVFARMMAQDMLSYLPDDILVKVDRAAMNVSLETRVPFLDHRVVEFAWRLPQSMKLRHGQTKWALRQVLYRYVPKELIERPKMGFAVPVGEWLRGPLRDWAEALLDESRLRNDGFFKPDLIRRLWQEHLSGQRNWQFRLWSILIFQAWLEDQRTEVVSMPSQSILSAA